MREFTKGEWSIKASKNKLFLDAIKKDKWCFEALMQYHYTLYGPATDQTEFVVDITTDATEEGFANAHLIAQSPKMYEEIELTLTECGKSMPSDRREALENVLAKARGESTQQPFNQ